MKKSILFQLDVKELTFEETRSINGGKPSKDTSFWYDLSYYVGYGISKSEIWTSAFWVDWSTSLIS